MTKAIEETAKESLKDDIDRAENGLTGTSGNVDDLPQASDALKSRLNPQVDEKPEIKK